MRTRSRSRREFLKKASLAWGIPAFVPASLFAQGSGAAPSERVHLGLIGCGTRGCEDLRGFMDFSQVRIRAVCDPVQAHRDRAKAEVDRKHENESCKSFADYRELIALEEIDAVLIATPDHWHSLLTTESCKAGKDIFCETPESLTLREGREMVETVQRYGRVFSGGSGRILGDYGDISRLIRGGAIGDITEVSISCGGPSGECDLPSQPLPEGIDWDLWIGPAPMRDFHADLIRGGFRPYRDFSGGEMTAVGTHLFGAALFATQIQHTGPVEILPPDGKDLPHLTFVFKNGVRFYHVLPKNGEKTGTLHFRGTEGELPRGKHRIAEHYIDLPGYSGRDLLRKSGIESPYSPDAELFADFLNCVKTRKTPFRDIESAHRAASIAHLGNIAYWLNRPLHWDPVREEIPEDELAARWLSRPKRSPWM